jgi:hypothetical protein
VVRGWQPWDEVMNLAAAWGGVAVAPGARCGGRRRWGGRVGFFFCVWVAEGDREGDLDRVFVATPFFLGVIIYID